MCHRGLELLKGRQLVVGRDRADGLGDIDGNSPIGEEERFELGMELAVELGEDLDPPLGHLQALGNECRETIAPLGTGFAGQCVQRKAYSPGFLEPVGISASIVFGKAEEQELSVGNPLTDLDRDVFLVGIPGTLLNQQGDTLISGAAGEDFVAVVAGLRLQQGITTTRRRILDCERPSLSAAAGNPVSHANSDAGSRD